MNRAYIKADKQETNLPNTKGVDRYGTGETRPPIFGPGGHYHECPPIFEESSQVVFPC